MHIAIVGPLSDRQFNKLLEKVVNEYDGRLEAHFQQTHGLDVVVNWHIESFYMITPSETFYEYVKSTVTKPGVVILSQRRWRRYDGALGWYEYGNISTSTVYTFYYMPWYMDSHNVVHEVSHHLHHVLNASPDCTHAVEDLCCTN